VPETSVIVASWGELTADEFFEIAKLRAEVFYVEQRIDEQEFDDADRASSTRHLWIADDAGVAAYLRTVIDDDPHFRDARHSFGRVIVRADRRGEGLAQRLIDVVIDRQGAEPMYLHAQAYVVPLYARYGFTIEGDEYIEAGLPHIMMYRPGS
jgi:ElaA protein